MDKIITIGCVFMIIFHIFMIIVCIKFNANHIWIAINFIGVMVNVHTILKRYQ